MEIITAIARREGRCNDSTGLRVGTTVEVAALVVLAGAVPALVGDSDTAAVAVKATAGVVVGTFTTVANTVGLGDKGK